MPETKADVGNLLYCGMSSISESVSMRECRRALSKVGERGLAWGELAAHLHCHTLSQGPFYVHISEVDSLRFDTVFLCIPASNYNYTTETTVSM